MHSVAELKNSSFYCSDCVIFYIHWRWDAKVCQQTFIPLQELPKFLEDLAATDADLPWNRSKNRFPNIKPCMCVYWYPFCSLPSIVQHVFGMQLHFCLICLWNGRTIMSTLWNNFMSSDLSFHCVFLKTVLFASSFQPALTSFNMQVQETVASVVS